MAKITDLDVLFPEDEVVKFDVNGKEYSIKMFIPSAVGFTILDNVDKIMAIFPGGSFSRPRISKDAVELVLKILSDVCGAQYPEITKEWIEKNIALPRQAFMVYKMALPVYDFLLNSGFLETVTPRKKPEQTK